MRVDAGRRGKRENVVKLARTRNEAMDRPVVGSFAGGETGLGKGMVNSSRDKNQGKNTPQLGGGGSAQCEYNIDGTTKLSTIDRWY